MFLSNPLDVSGRRPGCVGTPLQGVTVRACVRVCVVFSLSLFLAHVPPWVCMHILAVLRGTLTFALVGCIAQVKVVTQDGREVRPPSEEAGELRFKGDNLFDGYWKRPEATAETFDAQGYFKTGDVGAWSDADQAYRILGRESVGTFPAASDTLHSSWRLPLWIMCNACPCRRDQDWRPQGAPYRSAASIAPSALLCWCVPRSWQVSALETERVLLEEASVAEAVVLGIPDDKWGQSVAAIIRLRAGHNTPQAQDAIRALCNDPAVFSAEKRARRVLFMDDIPKNAMGACLQALALCAHT